MRVYTDILSVSVHTPNKEDNHVLLDYVISSTTYNDSFFVLAAIPAFYPDLNNTIQKAASADKKKHPKRFKHLRPYDHLYLLGDYKIDKSSNTPRHYPFAIDGYFMKRNYLVIAHYLLLKKMLANVGHIIFYSDGEKILSKGVVSAFADRIKKNTCDVVIVKTTKESHKLIDIHSTHFKNALTENKFRRNILKARKELEPIIKEKEAKLKSAAFTKLLNTHDEKNLWVKDPDPPVHEPEKRFLWITRRLDQDVDYEMNLYNEGKLQPIDMPFGVFRKISSFISRPSSGGK